MSTAEHQRSRPNILLITTDQQRFDTIHAAGAAHMWTPHLDWLCDTGIRFDRCYSDCPVCVPARATIMTGRHGYTNGLTRNASKPVPMAENPTLPGILTQAGYQTRAIGKMHFHPARAHYGFEHMELPLDYFSQHLQDGDRAQKHGIGQNEMDPVFSTTDTADNLTAWLCDRAIHFLDSHDPTRPFFNWLSFPKPHPPYDCSRDFWELYDGIELPSPTYGDWSEIYESIPTGMKRMSGILNRVHRQREDKLRNIRRAYYACISEVDYQLGRLFARMNQLDLMEGTWIIFTSDHGELLGDHHLGAKSVPLEGSWHIPMIIRPPHHLQQHPDSESVRDELVCLADILPTVLGMAGVDTPTDCKIDGMDMLHQTPPRTEIIGQCDKVFSVRSGKYNYAYVAHGGTELLFDLESDPNEQCNLAGSKEAKTTLEKLRGTLITHLKKHDSILVKDDSLIALPDLDTRGLRYPGLTDRRTKMDVLH